MDILRHKVWADTRRALDPLVLQRLATSVGYEMLLTDFGHPLQASVLALSTILPPKERVALNEAKDKWTSFWNGSLTLHGLFQLYGDRICMVASERFDQMPKIISKLQWDLFEMCPCTRANIEIQTGSSGCAVM